MAYHRDLRKFTLSIDCSHMRLVNEICYHKLLFENMQLIVLQGVLAIKVKFV